MSIVNQATLQGLFVGYKTLFAKAFAAVEPQWQSVATLVPSSNAAETYGWIGSLPRMREWLGERQVKSLSAATYTIRNKTYEATVGVPREAIEDDQVGIYAPAIQELGQEAAKHPDALVYGLLKTGFTALCYDSKPFFAADHKAGKKTYSNKGTAALTPETYSTARAGMMSLTDEEGRPLGVIPDLLVVPPALEGMARKILNADIIDGSTNTLKGSARLLVSPWLAGADTAWYLLCTSRAVKPLVYQERRKPELVSKTNPADDNVFANNEYLYGVDMRCNVGFTLPMLAYGSTGAGK